MFLSGKVAFQQAVLLGGIFQEYDFKAIVVLVKPVH